MDGRVFDFEDGCNEQIYSNCPFFYAARMPLSFDNGAVPSFAPLFQPTFAAIGTAVTLSHQFICTWVEA